MNFYLDTNIIVDFLSGRVPFYKASREIFAYAESKEIALFCSSHSFVTVHYLMRKIHPDKAVRKNLLELSELIKVLDVKNGMVIQALKSDYPDFEDAVQIFCSLQIESLSGFVTRNLRDFSGAEVEIFSPTEALDFIHKNLRH